LTNLNNLALIREVRKRSPYKRTVADTLFFERKIMRKKILSEFAHRCRRYAYDNEMTFSEMADLFTIKRSTFGGMCSGDVRPSIMLIERVRAISSEIVGNATNDELQAEARNVPAHLQPVRQTNKQRNKENKRVNRSNGENTRDETNVTKEKTYEINTSKVIRPERNNNKDTITERNVNKIDVNLSFAIQWDTSQKGRSQVQSISIKSTPEEIRAEQPLMDRRNDDDVLLLAELLREALPRASRIASDEFSSEDRARLRELSGAQTVFELVNELTLLCGERARNNIRSAQKSVS
jgi:hypothetical protein